MPIEYKVRSGDTLWRIAQRLCGNGQLYREIAEANNISNPDLIYVGQILTIPCTDDEEIHPIPDPDPENNDFVSGIDVSVWQGLIDWNRVTESGITFAIARASYGTNHDTRFQYNWHEMELAGLIRGAYHYFHVFQDARAQADLFINSVTIRSRDLPPVLDVETTNNEGATPQQWQNGIRIWLERVSEVTGRVPIIYTGNGAWAATVNSAAFGQYPLWIAHWGVNAPSIPQGWQNWHLWQYSATGNVNGINGNVDLDRFNGSLQRLSEFISLA